jgi:nucleoside-diphosphate-sugar epimerase
MLEQVATSVRSVIEFLAEQYRRADLLRFGAIVPLADEPAVLAADMSKARVRLGWLAPTAFEAGLRGALAQHSELGNLVGAKKESS